ncbi:MULTISPECIES: BREX system ATP-binding domain-containing protein [unclassified Streptomyces]|uniref:helix-turn-helix transcriptional regulator n=1 Tax=unclassified Streptomyces TaxID=2593676 RepID=UPI002E328D13|nr:BREX system ATP-binding domain-containing protein [Streptomyces sp. NBC_01268]
MGAITDVCAMLGAVETKSVSPVFVGRAGELTALTEALSRATAGEPQALLVGGEAGVGKTRLIEEFTALARTQGAVVAVGGCVEIGADGLPFAPFSTALRALHRRLPEELAAAADGHEGELARLLPEFGDVTHHEPAAEDSTARLFELTVRLLERIAADRTVVLVLEDLHWADASTRHLLAYLFRTLHRGRIVVVATYRADDIHRRHPLRPLLAELDRLRSVRRIELARFTRTEVHRQLTGILAAEPSPVVLDEVFERSDGNAFFVEELIASHECGTALGSLSESLRDLLLVRVEALPDDAQRVVRVVAEGGSTVEFDLLAAVARLAEDELIEALRAAVGANILHAAPDGDGYRFRHSLVREAVSDDLLPGERSRLNRRYAEALEEDPGLVRADARANRLATYWYHAHDAARALPAVLRASVETRKRYAYAEQLRLLERAMELWDDAPADIRRDLRPMDYAEAYPSCGCDPDTPLSYLDLLAEAAVAARLCGERERALKIGKMAHRLLDGAEDDDPLRSAWFWVERARLQSNLARGDGWDEIARAQDLVRGLPPSAVHAVVLAFAAGWGMLRNPGADALAAAERAVEYARLVKAEGTELAARLTLGTIMVSAGDIEDGLAEMREVGERTLALGQFHEASRAAVNISSALEGLGRSREAVEVATAGIAMARSHGLVDSAGWVRANLAESLLSLGEWDRVQEECELLLRTGAAGSKPGGTALLQLAHLAVGRGEPAAAAARLAEAAARYGTRDPIPQYTLPMTHLTTAVAAAEGRLADVRAELAAVAAAGFPAGTHRYGWPLVLVAVTAEADARGLPAAAEGRAAALDAVRRCVRSLAAQAPVWQAYGLQVSAELARAEGRDTAERWAEVVAAFAELDRPHELARARHRLADALLAEGGRREEAAAPMREAHATAVRLGAHPLREDVELLAARARLPLRAPEGADGPAEPEDEAADAFGLTPREQDVLRLVAEGRTNRRIAEELFISPKTASVHVSNILAKLGVAGRGEAAALAHRLRLLEPTG